VVDNINDVIEEFEEKFPQKYAGRYNIPQGEPRCDTCRYFTFKLAPKEASVMERDAADSLFAGYKNKTMGKCIKASKMLAKMVGRTDEPMVFSAQINACCSMHKPKNKWGIRLWQR
jgi:hypothetical protein